MNNNEKENIGKNIQEQLININKYQDQNNINKLNHSHKFKKILFILYYFILVFFRIFFTLVWFGLILNIKNILKFVVKILWIIIQLKIAENLIKLALIQVKLIIIT